LTTSQLQHSVFNREVEQAGDLLTPADSLSRVFAALADPIRRDMVARLADGDATVNELAAPYEVTVQAISKHLKVLEDSGLVSKSRAAQRRPVHLEAEVFDLMTKWIERYRGRAEERYRRLDKVHLTIISGKGSQGLGETGDGVPSV
jgi:DNA-binding transcriptional ArsR family regulator